MIALPVAAATVADALLRSTTDRDVGYAIQAFELGAILRHGVGATTAVPTGPCSG